MALSSTERRRLIRQAAETFDSLFALATPDEIRVGMAWYSDAAERLANAAPHLSPVKRAAVCAALSPNAGWVANLRSFDALTSGGARPHTVLPRSWDNALGVLGQPDDGEALRAIAKGPAPKTRSFALALLGDVDAAVIDRHMFRACGIDITSTHAMRRAYEPLAAALRRVAHRHGMAVPAMQAIVWTTQRALTTSKSGMDAAHAGRRRGVLVGAAA